CIASSQHKEHPSLSSLLLTDVLAYLAYETSSIIAMPSKNTNTNKTTRANLSDDVLAAIEAYFGMRNRPSPLTSTTTNASEPRHPLTRAQARAILAATANAPTNGPTATATNAPMATAGATPATVPKTPRLRLTMGQGTAAPKTPETLPKAPRLRLTMGTAKGTTAPTAAPETLPAATAPAMKDSKTPRLRLRLTMPKATAKATTAPTAATPTPLHSSSANPAPAPRGHKRRAEPEGEQEREAKRPCPCRRASTTTTTTTTRTAPPPCLSSGGTKKVQRLKLYLTPRPRAPPTLPASPPTPPATPPPPLRVQRLRLIFPAGEAAAAAEAAALAAALAAAEAALAAAMAKAAARRAARAAAKEAALAAEQQEHPALPRHIQHEVRRAKRKAEGQGRSSRASTASNIIPVTGISSTTITGNDTSTDTSTSNSTTSRVGICRQRVKAFRAKKRSFKDANPADRASPLRREVTVEELLLDDATFGHFLNMT
ncbi:hypothetical protein BC567DRAFT_286533, partial [Phyllosticta citribraziliensis]